MESNVDEVIKFVEQYKKAMSKGVDEGIKKLTEIAYDIVSQYCSANNLSNHLGNIKMSYDPINKIGTVSTNDEVIIFKEMGTGIVGSQNPHPSPSSEFKDWKYDKNEHGENGWWYPTTESDPNPYKTVFKDGQLRAWTKGLPSGSMFYNTFNDIKKYLDSTVSVEVHKSTNKIY